MFEETDFVLNTDSVPANISYKSFKTYNLPYYLYNIPTATTETCFYHLKPTFSEYLITIYGLGILVNNIGDV